MTSIALIVFSGFGHTMKQAEAVEKGVSEVAGVTSHLIVISQDGDIAPADWETLSQADAVIFGSPTYMGSVAWQFKKFADASSKAWGGQAWKNKLAAGFTNSGSMNGDKHSTISYFITLAMQHGMIWAGTGMMPANTKASQRNDINYLGAFSGLMAQSPADSSPEEGPLPGDLKTANAFGERIAQLAKRW